MSLSKITIDAIINADINKVWDCYTNPKHIINWNFASDDWHCPSSANDLRTGGKFSSRMEAKDGSFGFDFEATYDDVVLNELIAYTMSDGRQARVDFENSGDYLTLVKITFDPESTNSAELQRDGWQAILNNFKKYTEQIK